MIIGMAEASGNGLHDWVGVIAAACERGSRFPVFSCGNCAQESPDVE